MKNRGWNGDQAEKWSIFLQPLHRIRFDALLDPLSKVINNQMRNFNNLNEVGAYSWLSGENAECERHATTNNVSESPWTRKWNSFLLHPHASAGFLEVALIEHSMGSEILIHIERKNQTHFLSHCSRNEEVKSSQQADIISWLPQGSDKTGLPFPTDAIQSNLRLNCDTFYIRTRQQGNIIWFWGPPSPLQTRVLIYVKSVEFVVPNDINHGRKYRRSHAEFGVGVAHTESTKGLLADQFGNHNQILKPHEHLEHGFGKKGTLEWESAFGRVNIGPVSVSPIPDLFCEVLLPKYLAGLLATRIWPLPPMPEVNGSVIIVDRCLLVSI